MTSREVVDLVGHVAWPLASLLGLFWMRGAVRTFLSALAGRVGDKTSSVAITKDGVQITALADIRPELARLPSANPELPEGAASSRRAEGQEVTFAEERDAIYSANRRLFLAHILEPSKSEKQLYDVFIYIKAHKDASIDDVAKAEFFFGRYWGNRVYEGARVDGTIGVKTSAYGEFLCICRVHFKDGHFITLQRYIDFDSGKYLREVVGLNSTKNR